MVARPSSKSSTTYDCETIFFNSHLFYPNKPIHALVTVDHRNAVDASYIHDAPVAWIDRLTNDSLTACVYVAGRSERHDTTDVSLDWLVYQGAPDGSMGGVFQLDSEWWTGTTCEKVTMERAFSSPPLVLATLRHSVKGLKHDAASLWVEDIRTDSFSLCVRELQNFDGAHENISIVSSYRNDALNVKSFLRVDLAGCWRRSENIKDYLLGSRPHCFLWSRSPTVSTTRLRLLQGNLL